jgi:hypothetical protein
MTERMCPEVFWARFVTHIFSPDIFDFFLTVVNAYSRRKIQGIRNNLETQILRNTIGTPCVAKCRCYAYLYIIYTLYIEGALFVSIVALDVPQP